MLKTGIKFILLKNGMKRVQSIWTGRWRASPEQPDLKIASYFRVMDQLNKGAACADKQEFFHNLFKPRKDSFSALCFP